MRLLFGSLVVGAGIVVAAGLGGAALAAEFNLRLGHIFADTHPIGKGALALSEHVAEASEGRVKITVFPAGQLGGLRALEDAASDGLLDIAQSAAPSLQAIYAPVSVLTIPYAFRDEAHLEAAWGGPIGERMRAELIEEAGLRVLSSLPQPPRHISAKAPVTGVDDLAGLRIRVPQVPSWVAFFEKVGAVPTPIELGELVTSLQLGLVTAQENPYATMDSMKLADVQDYLVPTGHVRTLDFFLLSDATYQELPEELRAIVLEGGAVAERTVTAEWSRASETALTHLREAGMELVEVDVESIREATADLYKEFLDQENQELFEAIQEIR